MSEMRHLIAQASEMIDTALKQANEMYPLFHSLHEGYGVMKEEVEEATGDFDIIVYWYNDYWAATKADDFERARKAAEQMKHIARKAIAELAQVGAMAAKITQSMEGME